MIPSCDVGPDDSLENTRTLNRLEVGLRLWQEGGFSHIIVSGGIYSPGQKIPAAIIMKNWLVSHEVSCQKIIVEKKSLDTFENIIFSHFKIWELDMEPEITVVTHWQHCLRFKITFWRKYGLRISTVPIWRFINLRVFMQEWLFLLAHLIDKDGQNIFSQKIRENRAQ